MSHLFAINHHLHHTLKRRPLYVITWLTVCLSLLVGCRPEDNAGHVNGSAPPRAVDGVIDLSDWDFETDGPLVLDGEWAFYWDELLSLEEIEAGDGAAPTMLAGAIGLESQC